MKQNKFFVYLKKVMPLFWPLEIRVMHFAISYQYCEISMVQNLRTVIWVQLKVRLSLKVHHEAQIEARKHVAFRKPPTFLFFMNCEMEFETKSIPHRTVKRGLIFSKNLLIFSRRLEWVFLKIKSFTYENCKNVFR